MPDEIRLDAKKFSEMVSQWEDGGRYRVELIVTQKSNDGKTWVGSVDEVDDYGDAEGPDEEEMTPPPKPKAMPMKKSMPMEEGYQA